MQVIEDDNNQAAQGGTGGVIDLDDIDDDDDDGNMFAEKKYEEEKVGEDDIVEAKAGGLILKVRKYDLSITYDFYTQTPRLWLTGYNEDGNPLSQAEIF